MNIITVIPLIRGKLADTLSYFTAAEVTVGSIVSVPVRSKSIHAIVTEVRQAEDIKAEIRKAPYELKKLGKLRANTFFPNPFIEAAKSLSDYYATRVGAVIYALVSELILENVGKIATPLPRQTSFISGPMNTDDTYAVQGDDEDRISSWRSLIRQEFARKKSVAIYLPTVEDAHNMFHSLEKGVEGYIFILHSGLTKKQVQDTWTKIAESDHSIVVIATPSFSILPRSDIETLIIERENGRGWISQKAPYMDMRHALETIGRKQKQTVYRADVLLRTETLHRLGEHEISAGSPFKWRSISDAETYLIDMKAGITKNMNEDYQSAEIDVENPERDTVSEPEKPKFTILSSELKELIDKNHKDSTHMFVMAARRGMATATICADCETIVTCEECSSPVVLHSSKETGKNFFMCHKCGSRRSANETCKNCSGWRLTPMGIGIEKVAEEIRSTFPDYEVFQIDADSTKTEKQMDDVMAKFQSRPGSLLIGTESALLRLNEKVDYSAVVSLDSLFALPDFRIEEKIMYALTRLRSITSRLLIVQTRKPEEKVFEFGLKGNLSDFNRASINDRTEGKYPPFSVLIKITMEGKKEAISKEMASAQKFMEPREIEVFPAFTSTVRGNSVLHGLMRIETHVWPDETIVSKLRSLPPGVSVKINPESLL